VSSDQILMSILGVTGLFMAGGLAFQLSTGMRMHGAGSQRRRRVHRLVGYTVIAVIVVHLPLGIQDVIKAFTGG
jgi:hypothetical protein